MHLLSDAVPPVGSTSDTPILDTITRLLTAGGGLYQTIQLTDLNRQLISQGKQPLTPAQASAMSPQINVGVAPDTQTMLLYGLGGIGILFLLTTFIKSR
jgi:hypothetical protein